MKDKFITNEGIEIPLHESAFTYVEENPRFKDSFWTNYTLPIDYHYTRDFLSKFGQYSSLNNKNLKRYHEGIHIFEMLRSNIHNGEFDWEKIEEFFQEIDLESIGMDMGDYDEFLKQNAMQIPEEEGDFDVTLHEKTESVEGDVFELISLDKGIKHRFLCGSSTDSENWSKVLDDEKIDLLLTDPPYNVDYQGRTQDKLKIKNDKMNSDKFYHFLYDFFVNAYIFSNKGTPIYVFYADSEAVNFRQAILDSGYKLSSTLIWVKNSFVMGRSDYHMQHEPIIYGWTPGTAHPWYSDRKQSSTLRFDKPLRNAEHPTMKPLDLLEYLIKNSSKQKQIVADGFLGSGSTLIACEQNWRQCRGFELDPRFSDVIVRRWVSYMKERKQTKLRSMEKWNTTHRK